MMIQPVLHDPQITVGFWEAGPRFTIDRPAGVPYWIVFHPHNQPVWLNVSHQQFEISAHDLVLLQPNTPYQVKVVREGVNYWEFWANFIPPAEWEPLLRWPPLVHGVMKLSMGMPRVRRRVVRALRQMCSWEEANPRWSPQLAMNSLEQVLLLCQAMLPTDPQSALDHRVQAVIDAIHGQIAQPHLTVADLARAAHVSEPHLRTLFQEQLGIPPKRYIETQRIRRAQHLLVSTLSSIKQIAAATGFANAFHFSARFRQHTGSSPRQYRQQRRG